MFDNLLNYLKSYSAIMIVRSKRTKMAFNIIYLVFLIAYPIVAICVELGNLYINIAILSIATIYVIIKLILGISKKTIATNLYKWARIIISFVALVINVYSMYVAVSNLNVTALLVASLMIVFWVIQVVFTILYDTLVSQISLLYKCAKEDLREGAKLIENVPLISDSVKEFAEDDVDEDVLLMMKKADKANLIIKQELIAKNAKENYASIFANADKDHDGVITAKELEEEIIKNPALAVNKKTFFESKLTCYVNNKKQYKLLNDKGYKDAGIPDDEIDALINEMIVDSKKDIASIDKYVNDDGVVVVKTNGDKEKIICAIGNLLRYAQEIIYLYGLPQVNAHNISKPQMFAVYFALVLLTDETKVEDAKESLIRLKKNTNKVKIKNGFKWIWKNKEDLVDLLLDGVQLIVKGGAKLPGRLGLVFGAAHGGIVAIKKSPIVKKIKHQNP